MPRDQTMRKLPSVEPLSSAQARQLKNQTLQAKMALPVELPSLDKPLFQFQGHQARNPHYSNFPSENSCAHIRHTLGCSWSILPIFVFIVIPAILVLGTNFMSASPEHCSQYE